MKAIYKFAKEYIIRSYECNRNGDLRIVTLMNIFQDTADSHASDMNMGIDYCLTHGLAWVGANYHVQINRLPKMHEKITIISWPSIEKKLGAIRDFQILNEQGENIINATSQWILIDFTSKRPVILREHLPEYQAIPERSMESDFNKIQAPTAIDYEVEFKIRFDDIDLNGHVNNAVYPLWASESVNHDFRAQHKIKDLEIAFKKEGHFGENVRVSTQMLNDQTSIHSIKSTNDSRELSRVKIIWS